MRQRENSVKHVDYQPIPDWTRHFGMVKDAWLAISAEGIIQQINQAAAILFKSDAAALVGQKLAGKLVRRDTEASYLVSSSRGTLCALSLPDLSPALIEVEDIPCPLTGWTGRLLRLTDVTERLEGEAGRIQKLGRLTALADIMTLPESDRQRRLDEAMELGARALGLEFGVVARVDGDRFVIKAHNSPGLLQHGQLFPLDETYSSIMHSSEDVLALSPFLSSPYAEHPCFARLGYQSYIGIPLWVHGERYGTVSFSSRVVRCQDFNYNDKMFVRLLARWIGGVIERMLVEERLRESHADLEEQLELLAMAEKVARLGHWRLDTRLRTVLLSSEAHTLLGRPVHPEWGMGEFEAFIATEDRDVWRDQVHACLTDGVPIGLELRMLDSSGAIRWLSVRGTRLEQGDHYLLFGVMLDITDSKQAQETILFQASHDALTGLINRVLLFDRLGQEIRRSQRSDSSFAVLFLDLDFFKEINDRYGHEAGDRVLVEAGKRLLAVLRQSDTVGRFGGDEFIAIIPGSGDQEAIAPLVKKILRRLEAPIVFGKASLFISASIGASFYPQDATVPQDLIRLADNDMYRVKAARRQAAALLPASKKRGQ